MKSLVVAVVGIILYQLSMALWYKKVRHRYGTEMAIAICSVGPIRFELVRGLCVGAAALTTCGLGVLLSWLGF